MSHIFNSAEIKASSLNAETVKKKYINSELYWSAGSTVTYVVDTGTSYTEEVDSGASCLSPKTFTPSKDGWTFVGWREDTTASGSVLSSKVMESEPITLYAVYAKTITAHFISGIGGTNTQDVQGTSYYNSAGNVTTIDITAPSGASASGWSWRGWSKYWTGDATAVVFLANGGTTTINHENDGITYFGLYQQTITLSYNGNGSTSGSVTAQTGTRYHNSANNYSDPSFRLAANGFTRSDANSTYAFTGWDLGAVGASVTLSASKTAYAMWQATMLVVFSATHSGGSNTSVTGYATSINNTSYVTVNPMAWDAECKTANYSGNVVTVKNASIFSRAVVTYDVRKWASYGHSGDVVVEGTSLTDISDYTAWYSKSIEKAISSGGATISMSFDVSAWDDDFAEAGISAGVHVAITKVTLYA